jgi:hypothetical protein
LPHPPFAFPGGAHATCCPCLPLTAAAPPLISSLLVSKWKMLCCCSVFSSSRFKMENAMCLFPPHHLRFCLFFYHTQFMENGTHGMDFRNFSNFPITLPPTYMPPPRASLIELGATHPINQALSVAPALHLARECLALGRRDRQRSQDALRGDAELGCRDERKATQVLQGTLH